MTGNSYGEDSDDRRKLAFDFNEYFSFAMGVKYTTLVKLKDLSNTQLAIFLIYRRFGDLLTFLLFISNVVLLYTELSKDAPQLRVVVTGVGSVTFALGLWGKLLIYRRQQKIFDGVLNNILVILRNIENNPTGDKQFLNNHKHFVRNTKSYALGKFAAIGAGVTALTCFDIIHGFLVPDDRSFPLFGWYPFDPFTDVRFVIIALYQCITYQLFLFRDIAVDIIFLTILISFNSYLVYLRKLLGLIVKEMREDSTTNKENLVWWIKQHQLLLRTIEDFKIISDPYLLITYVTTTIIVFFGGVLVTSDAEYDWIQQIIAFPIVTANLLQLYIFSLMGDKITENALKVTDNGFEIEMLQAEKGVKVLYLFTITKSKKILHITFGSITPLSVHSFGKILEMCCSYFITVVQLRSKTT